MSVVQGEANRIAKKLETKYGSRKFRWNALPELILDTISDLVEISHVDGNVKREIVIQVLVDLCPDDNIDKMIPPFVDLVWKMFKLHQQKKTCMRLCVIL